MKWSLLFLAPLLALTGFAIADEPVGTADRLRLVRRDLALVELLVEGGLELAAQDDPLRRLATCNDVADGFAKEMRQAVITKDTSRAESLSGNLQAILVRGIATNLKLAHKQPGADVLRQKELKQAGERALRLIQPVEEHLDRSDVRELKSMQDARVKLSAARAEVERALQDRTPTLPAPPVGKKLGKKSS